MAIEFRQPCYDDLKQLKRYVDFANDDFSVVAVKNNAICGYAGAGRSSNYASLNQLYIHPNCLENGLKSSLIHHLLQYLRAEGVKKTHLFSMNFKNKDYVKDLQFCSV